MSKVFVTKFSADNEVRGPNMDRVEYVAITAGGPLVQLDPVGMRMRISRDGGLGYEPWVAYAKAFGG